MTLSFSQIINKKPNYFVDKIWNGFIKNDLATISDYQNYRDTYNNDFNKDFGENLVCSKPKIHTIREDNNNRWKAGNDVHFVINNRSSNRFQFAPIIKCVSVQSIEIRSMLMTASEYSFISNEGVIFIVEIDGKRLRRSEIKSLAINDGFDTIQDFFSYFNKDFTGKLINWTDLKY